MVQTGGQDGRVYTMSGHCFGLSPSVWMLNIYVLQRGTTTGLEPKTVENRAIAAWPQTNTRTKKKKRRKKTIAERQEPSRDSVARRKLFVPSQRPEIFFSSRFRIVRLRLCKQKKDGDVAFTFLPLFNFLLFNSARPAICKPSASWRTRTTVESTARTRPCDM